MDETREHDDLTGGGAKSWLIRLGVLIVVCLVLLLGWLLVVTLGLREWAHYIGDRTDGSTVRATTTGVVLGFVCTLVPLIVARQALRSIRLGLRLVFVLVALVLAAPNLLTLSIVVGTGSGAKAARRILDTDATGFRAGTTMGAVAAALIFGLLVVWGIQRWRDKRKIREYRALQAELAQKSTDDD